MQGFGKRTCISIRQAQQERRAHSVQALGRDPPQRPVACHGAAVDTLHRGGGVLIGGAPVIPQDHWLDHWILPRLSVE